MASIFTYDPDPPRVASPWAAQSAQQSPRLDGDEASLLQASKDALTQDFEELHLNEQPEHLHVTRLEAEPQEGPTEYKLHLLLRPRRSFASISTASRHVSGSRASPRMHGSEAPLAQSAGSRQHRLEQLTTQLLWRLQQSSPHHSSSASNVILPKLAAAAAAAAAEDEAAPGRLLPGLEESKGALYEIGVSDDGTFVGLAKDEMVESLHNLKTMAASLGCSVELLRMVPVGHCEWVEGDSSDEGGGAAAAAATEGARETRRGHLWVAEAYIKPELRFADGQAGRGKRRAEEPAADHVSTAQLRVSITGATTSGKSTLLGTLSTSARDNGRGSSRLSLLKHRHEIVSGVTSSVTQELIGYRDGEGQTVAVVNYGTADVVSWNNVHAESSRLALLTDSAGHPRYRRTTVRGLVGWAPHWTMLCIAANGGTDGDLASVVSDPSFSGASAHLSMAHLDLCLRLELPLVVVVTKLDAANKTTFRHILSALLSMLKAAGRKPVMLQNEARGVGERELGRVEAADNGEVQALCERLGQAPRETVPILLSSAVSGAGIGKLHALLRHLPIVAGEDDDDDDDEGPCALFHIDDTFALPASAAGLVDGVMDGVMDGVVDGVAGGTTRSLTGSIVSGYLARGRVSIGDTVLIGPFSTTAGSSLGSVGSQHGDTVVSPRSFGSGLGESRSWPKQRTLGRDEEWRRARVVSVRNLRLPVHSLQADQVGTIGVVAGGGGMSLEIRKGMVVAAMGDRGGPPQGTQSLSVALAADEASSLAVGTPVVLYSASVREAARVVAVDLGVGEGDPGAGDGDAFAFSMDDDDEGGDQGDGQRDGRGSERDDRRATVLVTFQFTSYRAWVQPGQRVLVMPANSSGGGSSGSVGSGGLAGEAGGVRGLAGLDGFAGRIVETFG